MKLKAFYYYCWMEATIMYRHNYNGKEIIIRFTSNLRSTKISKDYLYKKIVSICESILTADHETPFIVEDDQGRLAVGTVQHGDLTVISIHYIVEQSHMYLQRHEVKKPS